MMRRRHVLFFVLAAGCAAQPTDPTSSVEQAVTDCTIGNDFPNAKMPAQPLWTGQALPTATAKQGWVIWKDATTGYWDALLADAGQGVVVVAYEIKPASIATFLGDMGSQPRISVTNPPPPPPPTGTKMASYALEYELQQLSLPSLVNDAIE